MSTPPPPPGNDGEQNPYQQPHYGQQPPQGYQQPYGQPYPPQQPPKKRKIWPWVLGGIILVFILLFAGCVAIVGGIGSSIENESERTVEVTYRVTGDGGAASITYSDVGMNMGQDTSAQLPWEKIVEIDGLGKFVTLTATNDFEAAADASITCEIVVDGEAKFSQTATGPGASAMCSGDVG